MLNLSTLTKMTGAVVFAASASFTATAAEKVSDFSLIDHNGRFHQLSRYGDHDAVVLYVYDQHSEVVEDAVSDLNDVTERFADEPNGKIAFFMIDSTGTQDKAVISEAAAKAGIELPILMDDTQLVSEELGISRAGEVIILDPGNREVVYQGGA